MKGKAKEDFEKWYLYDNYFTPFVNIEAKYRRKEEQYRMFETFYSKPFSMQSGVLLEFFDSVGIKISIFHHHQGKFTFLIDNRPSYMYRDTREEALKEAFNKAEEIYNKNKDEK
jgi:hypothetical protein